MRNDPNISKSLNNSERTSEGINNITGKKEFSFEIFGSFYLRKHQSITHTINTKIKIYIVYLNTVCGLLARITVQKAKLKITILLYHIGSMQKLISRKDQPFHT